MPSAGNVQVDTTFLGSFRDTAVDPTLEKETLETWKSWAEACNVGDAQVIMQINHPGRQSPLGAGKKGFFTKAMGPSAVPLKFGDGYIANFSRALLFGTPVEMTKDDIQNIVKQFVYTASMAAKTGFAGVQIHAAHGYLLTQFLSEDMNQRTDEYGGSSENRLRIIMDIIRGIREVVPPSFCVSIKFNSVDHQSPAKLQECIEQLKLIADAGVDFVEISGGSYEDPTVSYRIPKKRRVGGKQYSNVHFRWLGTPARWTTANQSRSVRLSVKPSSSSSPRPFDQRFQISH